MIILWYDINPNFQFFFLGNFCCQTGLEFGWLVRLHSFYSGKVYCGMKCRITIKVENDGDSSLFTDIIEEIVTFLPFLGIMVHFNGNRDCNHHLSNNKQQKIV